jgi:adenine-specific DNA methylase
MTQPRSETRLIERWMPITEIGIESLRERTPMTPFPAPNRLHVWWARRPLVASRAAILASLLPADADHDTFKHVLGIHGDPVAAKVRISRADRTGERLGADAYGYQRAFKWTPDEHDRAWLHNFGERAKCAVVLDPTAGGGSIPLEAARLGLTTYGNDLNPVASIIELATIKWPIELGMALKTEFEKLGKRFTEEIHKRLTGAFPNEPEVNCRPDGYLWARTIRCPYCDGIVPLSPNWRLAPNGTGVRLVPRLKKDAAKRRCDFEIVRALAEQSAGTIADGDATCPFSDCARVIDGDEVKRQAQAGQMGEQLYTIIFKRRTITKTKAGKSKIKWVRDYRAPRDEDANAEFIADRLAEKLPEWEAMNVLPTEQIDELSNYDRGHRMYGMYRWIDMFSPRQLFAHCTSVAVFSELLESYSAQQVLDETTKAAFVYLSFALDKIRDYNSRATRWHVPRETMVNTFDSHNFAMKWSFAEMAILVEGAGFDWAIEQVAKCIEELVVLTRPPEARDNGELVFTAQTWTPPPVTLNCKPPAIPSTTWPMAALIAW